MKLVLVVAFISLPLVSLRAQTGEACSLITRAEAAQILGKPQLATAKVVTDDSDCVYQGAGFLLRITEVNPTKWSKALQPLIKSKVAETVSGLGDEAVFTTDEGDSVLLVRKGTHELWLKLYHDWGGAPAQVKPTLMKLGKTAVARLH